MTLLFIILGFLFLMLLMGGGMLLIFNMIFKIQEKKELNEKKEDK